MNGRKKRDRASEIANAIGLINENNMGSIAEEQEMNDLVQEYFLGPSENDLSSEDDESSDDELDIDRPSDSSKLIITKAFTNLFMAM